MRMALNNLGINMFLVAKRVLASKKVINRTMELGLVIIIAYLLQLYVILPMENNKLKQQLAKLKKQKLIIDVQLQNIQAQVICLPTLSLTSLVASAIIFPLLVCIFHFLVNLYVLNQVLKSTFHSNNPSFQKFILRILFFRSLKSPTYMIYSFVD